MGEAIVSLMPPTRTRRAKAPPRLMKEQVLDFYAEHAGRMYRPVEVAQALGLTTHFTAVASGRLARDGLIERHHLNVDGWTRPMTVYGRPQP